MKKLIFILSVALLTACSATTYQMKTTTVSFEDYSRNGFLITTSSIGTAYQSLGIVSADCQPGLIAKAEKPVKADKSDDIYGASPVKHTGQYGDCNKADLIDALYIQAVELKASGLIDVKFQDYSYGSIVYHSATGLAVKIK
jgi:hypothetical protein